MRPKTLCSVLFVAAIILFAACGGTTRNANPVVDVNDVDGSTDIAIDSIFTYTFAEYMNSGSVKDSTFFIVALDEDAEADAMKIEIGKADYDTEVCNPNNRIEATVENPILKAYTVYPTNDLLNDTMYAICITTEVEYFISGNFDGFMAYFTTAPLN